MPTANTHAANELRTIAHELDDLEPGEHEAPRPGGIVWPLVWVVLTIVVAMVIAGWFLIGPPSSAP